MRAVRGRVLPLCWDRGSTSRRFVGERGITSLELAIIFPAVLLVIMLMFQISLYWHTANAVGVAAERGLNAGQVFPEPDGQAEIEAESAVSFILSSSVNLQIPADIEVTRVAGGDRLRVSVSARTPRLVGVGGVGSSLRCRGTVRRLHSGRRAMMNRRAREQRTSRRTDRGERLHRVRHHHERTDLRVFRIDDRRRTNHATGERSAVCGRSRGQGRQS